MLQPTPRGIVAGADGRNVHQTSIERHRSKKERAKQLKQMLSLTDEEREEQKMPALSPAAVREPARNTLNDGAARLASASMLKGSFSTSQECSDNHDPHGPRAQWKQRN